MPSRVTQSMLNTQFMRNLNNNLNRMEKLQDQMSSGRRINKPSDDPVGISFSMRYRSELETNDQYQRNVDSAISWLSYSDEVLNQAGNVMQRARELAVQGATGTNPQEALNTIAMEIDQLSEQMLGIANSKFNGKYVFNGQLTDKQPYDPATPGSSIPDTGAINFEIGVGVKIPVNVSARNAFGQPGSPNNIFVALKELSDNLKNGNIAGVSNSVGKLDERMDAFLAVRADIGAKTNRIELAEDRLKDININLSSLKSKTEDADMAAVIMNLKMDENVYQASLSAGSRLIQPSLIDFIR
ncbi:MAG TPA: flagellar hook-associated protein FlgL [Paenibacillus sp.]|nr:flagellar hook-associated protein FlgL [Paenibacillus sp.]